MLFRELQAKLPAQPHIKKKKDTETVPGGSTNTVSVTHTSLTGLTEQEVLEQASAMVRHTGLDTANASFDSVIEIPEDNNNDKTDPTVEPDDDLPPTATQHSHMANAKKGKNENESGR